jgi:phage-related holin
MANIDWAQKLTSRKLWAAVCSLVTNLILAFGGSQSDAVKITATIMAGASVIAYIIGEGLVDANRADEVQIVHIGEEDKPPEEEDGNG